MSIWITEHCFNKISPKGAAKCTSTMPWSGSNPRVPRSGIGSRYFPHGISPLPEILGWSAAIRLIPGSSAGPPGPRISAPQLTPLTSLDFDHPGCAIDCQFENGTAYEPWIICAAEDGLSCATRKIDSKTFEVRKMRVYRLKKRSRLRKSLLPEK